jgi:hypothetical protein
MLPTNQTLQQTVKIVDLTEMAMQTELNTQNAIEMALGSVIIDATNNKAIMIFTYTPQYNLL